MTQTYSLRNLDPVNTLFLLLTPLLALASIVFWVQWDGFDARQIYFGLFFYVLCGISITAGYHRLFSHRAYDAHPAVKLFFLIFGAASFQNSVYKWGTDHRQHHHQVDTENDPYCIGKGFFYAHIGWVLLKSNDIIHEKFSHDFRKDPLVMWQKRYYLPLSVISGIVLPTLLGGLFFDSFLGGFAVAGLGRVVLVHHCTFFINSLCHYVGSTPYTRDNTAKDSWYMSLLTFGEGYHNFHHLFQTDYRNGVRWYHFDPTKWLIQFLANIGLAYRLRVTSVEKILAAKMQMNIELIKERQLHPGLLDEIEALKIKIVASFAKWQEFKQELKIRRQERNQAMIKELRLKVALARLDFNHSLKQWRLQLQVIELIHA